MKRSRLSWWPALVVPVVAGALAFAVIAPGHGVAGTGTAHHPAPGQPAAPGQAGQPEQAGKPVAVPPPLPAKFLGVAGLGPGQLPAYAQLTGTRPDLAEVYLRFGEDPADLSLPKVIATHAVPLVTVDPRGNHVMQDIADDDDFAYLRRLGRYLGSLQGPVAVALAPEENGDWFAWGCRQVTSSVYIAAWQNFEAAIRPLAPHVIWTWIVNKAAPGTCPVAADWPGASLVDWVGIDAYWRAHGDTWATVVGPVLADVRKFTDKPVLLTETGATTGPDAAGWVQSVFSGAESTPGVIGVTWFDTTGQYGDYRLNADPPALAAFRTAAARFLQSQDS